MSLYIIVGRIYNIDKEIGLVILNDRTGRVRDISLPDIIKFAESNKIENLEVKQGEILWKNGDKSKYPIKCTDGSFKNENCAVVIGDAYDDKFIVSNIHGKIVEVSENDLIIHAKKFGIANACIQVFKGKEHISILKFNREMVQSNIKFYFNAGVLAIDFPNDFNSNELIFPDSIGESEYIERIKVSNEKAASQINKITFGKYVEVVGRDLLKPFPNVEYLYFENNALAIADGAIANLTKLKEVHANRIDCIGSYAFANCISLKYIKVKNGIRNIFDQALEHCPSFDIQDLINNEISYIGSSVFKGCNAKSLVINNVSLKIKFDTFKGIKGLKDIHINGVNVAFDEVAVGYKPDAGWLYYQEEKLRGFNGKIYIADNNINWFICELNDNWFVKVNTGDTTLSKYELMGYSGKTGYRCNTYNDAKLVLQGLNDDQVRDIILDVEESGRHPSTNFVQVGKFTVYFEDSLISSMSTRWKKFDFKGIGTVYTDKRKVVVLIYNKDFIINYLEYHGNNVEPIELPEIKAPYPVTNMEIVNGSIKISYGDKFYTIKFSDNWG